MILLPEPAVELMTAQHGLISRAQCADVDISETRARRLVRSGRWELAAPGVFSVAEHRRTWVRSLWVAHLYAGPDSVISHESAGRLLKYEQVPAGRIVLMAPRDRRHGPAGVRRHRADDLAPEHVTHWQGLPITTPVRTMFDLASVLHIATFRKLIETQILEHNVSVATLGAFLDDVRRRGKPGIAVLARVLDDLGPGEGLSRSELERLLDAVIARSGLPAPVHEYPLPGRGAMTGFVDRCWPDARLIVEGDGRKWHARTQDALRDATRSLEAQAVGFETTRLLWEHLAHDPNGTAELLRLVFEQRSALLGRGAS